MKDPVQSFKMTSGIQSVPPDKPYRNPRSIMIFIKSLGVTETLCKFRLEVAEKIGKERLKSSR